jgi:hypothetical protein
MTRVAAQEAWCISAETLCLFSSSGSSKASAILSGEGLKEEK